MTRRSLSAFVVALGALAALHAPARAQDLEKALDRVAAAWHKGDAAAIAALAARAGISVDVDGSAVGPLGQRQAAAVLRRVFDDRESLSARPTMSRTTGSDGAFGEITWMHRAKGTTIPQRATVFIALTRENGSWHVSEIRLLR